jgi:hypothetical protein
MVKMRFLVGIARRIAETNGVVNFPQVRELLGSLGDAKHDGGRACPLYGAEGPHAWRVFRPG